MWFFDGVSAFPESRYLGFRESIVGMRDCPPRTAKYLQVIENVDHEP